MNNDSNLVYYPVTAKEIESAQWQDCNHTIVVIVPRPNRPGSWPVNPDYPPLVEWVANGGIITEPNWNCLEYARKNKIYDIEKYCEEILELNEPSYDRKTRISKTLACCVELNKNEVKLDSDKAMFDYTTYCYASFLCNLVKQCKTVEEINLIDVKELDWPNFPDGD